MTTLRQAAQQALEALGEINKLSVGENAICLPAEIDGAMDALRAALAEPVQQEWASIPGTNVRVRLPQRPHERP